MGYILKMPISEEHAQRIHKLAAEIRKDPVKGKHTAEILSVTSESVASILEYLFIEPLNRVNAGAITRKGAAMGIKTGMGMFTKIAKGSFGKFDGQQLVDFADWLEEGLEKGEM